MRSFTTRQLACNARREAPMHTAAIAGIRSEGEN